MIHKNNEFHKGLLVVTYDIALVMYLMIRNDFFYNHQEHVLVSKAFALGIKEFY